MDLNHLNALGTSELIDLARGEIEAIAGAGLDAKPQRRRELELAIRSLVGLRRRLGIPDGPPATGKAAGEDGA